MYNTGNSSKNVSGSSIVDGSLETADIADSQVTYAKIQNVSATDRILGRDTTGAGDVEEIAPSALRTIINVEDGADVTDTTNVTSAGALMDSEVTNLADVKAFDKSDYATAAQGSTADAALAAGGGTMTGALTAEGSNTFGKSDSGVTQAIVGTANWNYPELKIQRNASNTANFKAISFMLDGDTDAATDLYEYPSIIINTDTAPTASDTSAAENASLTINAPSTIRFGTGSAERMRIQSGGGISFNGDTAAANALDDYEEGNWVPAQGTGVTVVGDFTSGGTYTKIGNHIWVQGWLKGSTSIAMSGIGTLSTLPISIGYTTSAFSAPWCEDDSSGVAYCWNTAIYTGYGGWTLSATGNRFTFQTDYPVS